MAAPKTAIQVELIKEGDAQRLVYRGPINEDMKPAISRLIGTMGKYCRLDLGSVTFLNSSGIRDWSYLVKAMKQDRELEFENCTDEVIRTMNMVVGFRAGLKVKSLYRAYSCDACGHEQTVYLQEGRDYAFGQVPAPITVKCEKCAEVTAPCEEDEVFFSFLTSK